MAAVLFDSHDAVKRLQDAGADEALAEAVVDTYLRGFAGNVATKADTAEIRTELKSDIAELRTELKNDIAELRTELKGDITELRTELKSDIAALDKRLTETKADIAGEFKNLYKHLWIMGASIVALNVTLTVTLTKALS